ncbi:MAG TPA: TolC family protein [Lentimicrobium sp.]|nr:TolC family protein [Lentimicrobium sp.]
MIRWLLIAITCSIHINTMAQLLTAEEAVAIALKNNYSIRLANLNEQTLENNYNLGIANFIPTIDAQAQQNNNITNTRQEYLSGQINEKENAKSKSFTAGVGIDWTLFDGLRMFTGYSILKQQLLTGQLQTRLQVENTISEVLSLYYNIVELRQMVNMFEKSVQLGQARVNIADEKLAIGAGSRLELLQARVDMNSDISEMLNLNDLIAEATIRMNLLLGRNAETEFLVEDSIKLMPLPDFNQLKAGMQNNNVTLLMNSSGLNLAKLNLKAVKGKRFPEIGLIGGYDYSKQSSESGFVKSGKSNGFNYGITASWPLFNGLNQIRDQKNAKIGVESAMLEYESFSAELNAQLLSTYSVYSNKLKTIELEKENLQTAFTNFDIANERYRLGELSGIEIREAQQNLLLAESRLISLVYEARLLEIKLIQLSGGIIPYTE